MFGPVHHVGVACRDLARALNFVESNFETFESSGVIRDDIQNVDIVLVRPREGPLVELIAGPMVESLSKSQSLAYHLCFVVPDLDMASQRLRSSGCRLVRGPLPAIAFGHRRVAFASSPLGLIEMLEAQSTIQ